MNPKKKTTKVSSKKTSSVSNVSKKKQKISKPNKTKKTSPKNITALVKPNLSKIFDIIQNIWIKIVPKNFIGKILILIFSMLIVFSGKFIFKDLPSPTNLSKNSFPVSTLIFDRNGELLYEIFADENRTPITLDSLPPRVAQATIAIEDQEFYRHFGFSIQGIVRAFKNTVFKQKLQGGSTITQQLVKTALLTPERTIQRKLREAVLTIAVEVLYSKEEILEMYLNHIPYGGTAYGIQAASHRFFAKPASDLSLAETSLLVGLPQAPTAYSPFSNPEKAKARQFEVLRRMAEEDFISQGEADQAFEHDLKFAPPATDIRAPHFVFYVKSILEERFGIQTVERGGLRVITTLDISLQDAAQASLSAHIESLERYKVSNGALLATKPNTGEILAMVGSKSFFNDDIDGKVNVTTRLRQPGSSIKPLNYVTGLQLKNFTLSSVLLDIPTCFKVSGQPKYCPKNYNNSFNGVTNFRSALATSLNIPAVKVLAKNSLESFIATASAMGISTFTDHSRYGLSLTLGGGEVTMLDMSTAFGTLANQGVRKDLEPFLKIEDYRGEVLFEYQPDQTKELLKYFFDENQEDSNKVGEIRGNLTRILQREPAFLMTNVLTDNDARTPVFGRYSDLYIPGQVIAAKTGTTNDNKDSWTIGYTPEYLVASWVGNNDSTSMGWNISGINGAAPIFNDAMSFILETKEATSHAQPKNIEGTNICSLSGLYPVDGQPCQSRYELFWKDSMPEEFTAIKKGIWVNKETGVPAFTSFDQESPPENTDNLELQEHIILNDYFTTDFCYDCAWPRETKEDGSPGKITYPTTTIDMSTQTSETKLNQ